MQSTNYSVNPRRSSDTESPIIETHALDHMYDGDVKALENVNLQIAKGGVVAIVGSNGSGKTTLIKHFNGLLKPTCGTVLVQGMDTRQTKTSTLAQMIGFVFQNPDHQIFASSVLEETVFGLKQLKIAGNDAVERAMRALEAVGLYEMRDRHPRQLSRGQRQRLATASVLVLETPVLVLDEPTTGQDFVARRQIMSLAAELNRQGRTIIMVTHDMTLVAEYAERVIVMKSGKVLMEGTPRDVFLQDDVLRQTGLKVPPIIELSKGLNGVAITDTVLTQDQLYDAIISRLSSAKGLSKTTATHS